MEREPKSQRPAAKRKRTKPSATKARQPDGILPVPKKIGEGDDNLKQRQAWFRRRTTNDNDHG
jgi:hypothetical protein